MKILIIKFAAIGDVLRTTPILYSLKKRYPRAQIWWLTEEVSYGVLSGNKFINKLLLYNKSNIDKLKNEYFDVLINLDKDKRALEATMDIPADTKKGFGKGRRGKLIALDVDSSYAYRLGIDDELKFKKNKKTYQQISFEQIGSRFNGEGYVYKNGARHHKKRCLAPFLSVGIVTGSGKTFAGKKLPFSSYVKIIEGLLKYHGIQVVLLGGPEEKKTNKKLAKLFKGSIIDSGCDNTIDQFAGIINNCDVIITGDTLTMHLGIALNKYIVVFFGSTAANEIELYGKGVKMVPQIKCSPCYKKKCPINEKCMQLIQPQDIIKHVINASGKLFPGKAAEKILFLDRDGVINKERITKSGYITKPSEFMFQPGLKEAFKLLKENHFKVIIISNQAGVAKGLYTQKTLDKITQKMIRGISKLGGSIEAVYYCTHDTKADCPCRKPKPGLFYKAAKERNIDFKNTYYIGDTERDAVAGKEAGMKTIAVSYGKTKRSDIKKWKKQPDYIVKDLYTAVKKIVLKKVTK